MGYVKPRRCFHRFAIGKCRWRVIGDDEHSRPRRRQANLPLPPPSGKTRPDASAPSRRSPEAGADARRPRRRQCRSTCRRRRSHRQPGPCVGRSCARAWRPGAAACHLSSEISGRSPAPGTAEAGAAPSWWRMLGRVQLLPTSSGFRDFATAAFGFLGEAVHRQATARAGRLPRWGWRCHGRRLAPRPWSVRVWQISCGRLACDERRSGVERRRSRMSGVVSVPVFHQERAMEFYVKKLGFELVRDDDAVPGIYWLQASPSGRALC